MPTHSSEPQQALGGETLCASPQQKLHRGGLAASPEGTGQPTALHKQPPPSLAFVLLLGRTTLSSRLPQSSGGYSSALCSHTPLARDLFPPEYSSTNTQKILPLILKKPTLHAGTQKDPEENSQEEGPHSTPTAPGVSTPHPPGQGTPHLPPGLSPVPSAALADKSPEEAVIKTTGLLISASRLPQSPSHESPTYPHSTSPASGASPL